MMAAKIDHRYIITLELRASGPCTKAALRWACKDQLTEYSPILFDRAFVMMQQAGRLREYEMIGGYEDGEEIAYEFGYPES